MMSVMNNVCLSQINTDLFDTKNQFKQVTTYTIQVTPLARRIGGYQIPDLSIEDLTRLYDLIGKALAKQEGDESCV
jgi:hypothetical protein